MRRFLLSAAAVSLSLALAGTADAGGKHVSKSSYSSGSGSWSSKQSFTHYKGKEHYHWSKKVWFEKYGCYCYWDPYVSCYYYYCVPDDCYYPVDYCPHGKYCW
jgi:hypothetical protein